MLLQFSRKAISNGSGLDTVAVRGTGPTYLLSPSSLQMNGQLDIRVDGSTEAQSVHRATNKKQPSKYIKMDRIGGR